VRKAALFLVALGVAIPLLAQPQVPDGKWWKRPRIASAIGLTEEQSNQIEKIFLKSRPQLIDLKADLEKKQVDLQSAVENHASDRRDIEKKIDSVEEARKQLQKARALMILDIRQVLKPEQWDRLLQMQQAARERRRQMLREDSYRTRPRARPPASSEDSR
jgi:Spy/CpxP family protein refolding chaperone